MLIDQFLIVNFSDFLSAFKYAEPLKSAFKFIGFFVNASAILNPGGGKQTGRRAVFRRSQAATGGDKHSCCLKQPQSGCLLTRLQTAVSVGNKSQHCYIADGNDKSGILMLRHGKLEEAGDSECDNKQQQKNDLHETGNRAASRPLCELVKKIRHVTSLSCNPAKIFAMDISHLCVTAGRQVRPIHSQYSNSGTAAARADSASPANMHVRQSSHMMCGMFMHTVKLAKVNTLAQ